MDDARAAQRLDRHPGRLQRACRRRHFGVRDQRILGAVDEQDRRSRAQFGGKQFRGDQPARKAQDPGHRLRPAQADEQRHDGALREADESQIARREPARLERFVGEGVEDRRRRPHAGELHLRAVILNAVPLIAMGREIARERRVRRQDFGFGEVRRPIGREPDQVVAVGAEAVQQQHEPARLAARGGAEGGSGERQGHRRQSLEARQVGRGSATELAQSRPRCHRRSGGSCVLTSESALNRRQRSLYRVECGDMRQVGDGVEFWDIAPTEQQ